MSKKARWIERIIWSTAVGFVVFLLVQTASSLDVVHSQYALLQKENTQLNRILRASEYYTNVAGLLWGERAKRCDAGMLIKTESILREYGENNLSLERLLMLGALESGFNDDIISSMKAIGRYQILLSTAQSHEKDVTEKDLKDGIVNTRIAIKELIRLNKVFGGDWELTLLAYNRGQGRVSGLISSNVSPRNGYSRSIFRHELSSSAMSN